MTLTLAGVAGSWVTDPSDPRLGMLWPGGSGYGEDLAFLLAVARAQCEAYAPALTGTEAAPWESTDFASGFSGTLTASRDDGAVTWAVEAINGTGADLTEATTIAESVPEAYRPAVTAYFEVASGGSVAMGSDGSLTWAPGGDSATWPDGLQMVALLNAPGTATAPVVVPDRYVAAQVLQTRALVRAGIADTGDMTGGYGETVTVFPMDWQVKALLRPAGKPVVH